MDLTELEGITTPKMSSEDQLIDILTDFLARKRTSVETAHRVLANHSIDLVTITGVLVLQGVDLKTIESLQLTGEIEADLEKLQCFAELTPVEIEYWSTSNSRVYELLKRFVEKYRLLN